MEENSNKHIYIGIGTFSFLILGAFIVYRATRHTKLRGMYRVDYTVFDSPDLPGSGRCMDKRLIYMLQQLEARTGYPIFRWINSGARSPVHNRKVGGVSNSSHNIPRCKAVDIKTPSKQIRNLLVTTARDIGFKRIGVGKTFVHLDTDNEKAQYVAWGYPSGTPAAINPFI